MSPRFGTVVSVKLRTFVYTRFLLVGRPAVFRAAQLRKKWLAGAVYANSPLISALRQVSIRS